MQNVHSSIKKFSFIISHGWFSIYNLKTWLYKGPHSVNYSDASVSRRMREMRDRGYDLQKRITKGKWEYKLVKIKGEK